MQDYICNGREPTMQDAAYVRWYNLIMHMYETEHYLALSLQTMLCKCTRYMHSEANMICTIPLTKGWKSFKRWVLFIRTFDQLCIKYGKKNKFVPTWYHRERGLDCHTKSYILLSLRDLDAHVHIWNPWEWVFYEMCICVCVREI